VASYRQVRAQSDPQAMRGEHRPRQAQGDQVRAPLALDASQRRKDRRALCGRRDYSRACPEYECGEATIWRVLQGPFDMAA
jgi:hypothetical protein